MWGKKNQCRRNYSAHPKKKKRKKARKRDRYFVVCLFIPWRQTTHSLHRCLGCPLSLPQTVFARTHIQDTRGDSLLAAFCVSLSTLNANNMGNNNSNDQAVFPSKPRALFGRRQWPWRVQYPYGIEYDDSHNTIVMSDWNNRRLQVFDSNGWFVSSFGSRGSNHGQFFYPCQVSIQRAELTISWWLIGTIIVCKCWMSKAHL